MSNARHREARSLRAAGPMELAPAAWARPQLDRSRPSERAGLPIILNKILQKAYPY